MHTDTDTQVPVMSGWNERTDVRPLPLLDALLQWPETEVDAATRQLIEELISKSTRMQVCLPDPPEGIRRVNSLLRALAPLCRETNPLLADWLARCPSDPSAVAMLVWPTEMVFNQRSDMERYLGLAVGWFSMAQSDAYSAQLARVCLVKAVEVLCLAMMAMVMLDATSSQPGLEVWEKIDEIFQLMLDALTSRGQLV